jgi:short subunit dehydrogenase-like uncharacterized protein
MSDPVLIYGATGYTGRLMTRGALELGLRPVLAGRNASKLAALAEPLGLEYRVAPLPDGDCLDAVLRDVRVLLNGAGPFSETARPLVEACLRTGTHYLDITGELAVIESLTHRHAAARRRQIMIMPGAGFDVVPSDCLAAHAARRLPGAVHLALGIRGLVFTTRGSAKTFVEQAGRDIQIRRNGVLTSVVPGSLERRFDYGDGDRASVNVTWGDVSSAYYTTGIPNIEVYFEATPLFRNAVMASRVFGWMLDNALWQAWLKTHADFLLPEGPTEEQRAAVEMVIVAEAEDGRGRRVRCRLRTPQAYTLTGMTAPAIAQRVLQGDLELGFQTPGRVYGPDFVLAFANVSREDLV